MLKFKLKNCPECSHNIIWMNRTYYGRYFAECSKCHYVGRTRFFKFLATYSWNKECEDRKI